MLAFNYCLTSLIRSLLTCSRSIDAFGEEAYYPLVFTQTSDFEHELADKAAVAFTVGILCKMRHDLLRNKVGQATEISLEKEKWNYVR